MASSGSITTTGNYRNVTFSWSIQSQSVANNTTTISWEVVGAQDGTDGWYYAGPFSLTINGTAVFTNLYPSGNRIQLRKGTVVKSGTTIISHTSDGTKTFSATLTAAIYDLVDQEKTGSWTLTVIPRASTATIANEYAVGDSHTISISRKNSSFYHRVTYKWGSSSETVISSNAGTSCSLDLTNWGSNIPGSFSTSVTIYLRTYPSSTDATNRTNQIGSTATYSTSFVVPDYDLATPTVTRSEGNSANTTGVYLQSISKMKYVVSDVTAQYGSPLSYSVSVDGQTVSGSTPTLTMSSPVAHSGNIPATVTVTDGRGKTSSKNVSTTVEAYTRPTITVAKAARSTSNAGSITCTISCAVSSVMNGTEKNSMTAHAIYSTTSTFPDPASTYKFSTTGINATNVTKTYSGLSSTSTYYILFRVADAFGFTTQVVKVGTGGILHITQSGIGVMKRRENGALDVDGSIYGSQNVITGNLTDTSPRYCRAQSNSGAIYLDSEGNETGDGYRGLWLNAHGAFTSGRWLIYSHGQTGDTHLPGSVVLSSNPMIRGSASGFPRTSFATSLNDYEESGGWGLWFASSGAQGNLGGRIYSYSSSTYKNLSYREDYWLPAVTADRTSNANYYMLTTKAPVTVAQGGTGATGAYDARNNLGLHTISLSTNTDKTITLPNSYRGLLLCAGTTSGTMGIYSIWCSAASVTHADAMISASNLTFNTATANKLIITSTYAYAVTVVLLDASNHTPTI